MNLFLNSDSAIAYHSNSQKIRVITEKWAGENLFCPYCGNSYIAHFENNRPVADFFCPKCNEEFELKSKHGTITSKISDGAYDTMLDRISSSNNPSFFFMRYDLSCLQVVDLIIIPKYYFTPDIIEKRKPLAETAHRAGWIGCNIAVRRVPEEGRIFVIKNREEQTMDSVVSQVKRTEFIRQYKMDARGWILDMLNCINQIEGKTFTLKQMYGFVDSLSKKHPDNHHIKDKIRQQLQVLRDKGVIEFNGRGLYRKT